MTNAVEINDLGSIGAVSDTPAYQLPPEAFTNLQNCRIINGGIEGLPGWEQIFGTPLEAPRWAMPIRTAAATFWLYTSLTKAYGFDGTTHTNITRQTAAVDVNYTATDGFQWNGTLLGGIPVFNNGVDVPQFWAPTMLAQKAQDLTNWPATLRAKVIRAFGPFLIAIGITKAGTSFPHMVKWSHSADPGSLPTSWDETDPTKDTGEVDMPDVDAGILLDMLPLANLMYLYKENSVWRARFVGGRSIFDFGQSAWLQTTGLLAPRCVCVTGDGTRHVWASQDDIMFHDGNKVRSLLTDKQRRRLFNEIDTNNFNNSFIFCNPTVNEIWFCYPSGGTDPFPTRALVLNYTNGGDSWPITEVDGITFRNATIGPIEGATDETWEANENLWDDDDGPWSELARRRVVLVGTAATKFYNMDKGATRDGTVFTKTVRREGLALLGKKRNGEWIVDFNRRKLADMLWPKIQGDLCRVRIGSQERVDGSITWNPAINFNPLTQSFCNPGPVEGRAIAIEFATEGSFRIDGYNFDVMDLGMF